MRQTITALLLALVLALGLSGCTDKTQTGTTNSGNDSSTNSGESGSYNNGNTNNGNTNNGNTNNGTKNGGTNSSDSYNSGSSYNGGANNSSDGTIMDETENLLRGRSYEDMLRNGRVNDTDGDLTDGENHTSR